MTPSTGLALSRRWAWVAVAAGFGSLLGTYWDDSWHTDRGRDDAWIPPHLLLYGAVAVAGVVVAGWGVAALRRTRSVPAVLRRPPLLLAGLGGTATLAAAPVDAAWHSAFGRDAVLWSPPHMLAVTGSVVLVVGVVAGVAPGRRRALEACAVALLLGALLVPVLEYETDVPQFPEVWYLPVLLASALSAATLSRTLLPGRRVVAPAVVGYAAFRLAVIGVLALLGFSTPDLPVAVLGLAGVDLPWRTAVLRYAAAAAAISGLALLAAVAGHASQPVGQIVAIAAPLVVVVLLVMARGRPLGAAALLLSATALALAAPAARASAHDPGQGPVIGGVRLTASSDGRGGLSMTAELAAPCPTEPVAIVARRAGSTARAPLAGAEPCRVSGSLIVPGAGRWFLYVELRDGERLVEAWLPVEADRRGTLTADRELYVPSGASSTSGAEVAAGAAVYGLIGLLLLVAARGVRQVRTAGFRNA